MTAPQVPAHAESALERLLVQGLKSFNILLHVVLALALVAASVMVVYDFLSDASDAFRQGDLAQGFLHALGGLFILWTLSALISAEITYLRTRRFRLRVFLEVAMITLLRQLIVQPVQMVAGDAQISDGTDIWRFALLLASLLVLGVLHWMVGESSQGDY